MVSRWEINRCSVCVATLSVKVEVWGVVLLTFHCLDGSVKLFYQVNLFGAAPLFIYLQGFQRISMDRLANLI